MALTTKRDYVRADEPRAAAIARVRPRRRGEVEAIVETLSAELDDVAATLTDTIHEHLDELDDDMRVWTLQSTRSNLGVMVTMMREGADPAPAVPPPEALAYAKEYVVRGLDFGLLQRAYRTAQGVSRGCGSSACAGRPTTPTTWPRRWASSTTGSSPGSRRSSAS